MNDNYDSSVIVQQWLRDHHIPFTTEQSFEGLMGDYNYLRFDIYLEQYRMCIEVDGQQHYKIDRTVNADVNAFLKKRDYARRKEWFCYQHGIFLMRLVWDELPYLDQILGFLIQ